MCTCMYIHKLLRAPEYRGACCAIEIQYSQAELSKLIINFMYVQWHAFGLIGGHFPYYGNLAGLNKFYFDGTPDSCILLWWLICF